jgi:hypothetical protein
LFIATFDNQASPLDSMVQPLRQEREAALNVVEGFDALRSDLFAKSPKSS